MNSSTPIAYDQSVELYPGLRRITANNPGLMTGPGTNTYIVGTEELVVVDPGPDDGRHLDAIVGVVSGAQVVGVALTHTHSDHAAGARQLAGRLGTPLFGFGRGVAYAGELPEHDADLVIDEHLLDGEEIAVGKTSVVVRHTPGHANNHLCFEVVLDDSKVLLTGDHLMGGSTVVIAPPDGDMDEYMLSLRSVRELGVDALAPGHGLVISDPTAYIDSYIAHRAYRQREVLAVMTDVPQTPAQVAVQIYSGIPGGLAEMARYTTWAHLISLARAGLVKPGLENSIATTFELQN